MKLFYSTLLLGILMLTAGCSKKVPEACFNLTNIPDSYITEGYPEFKVNSTLGFDASCSKDASTYQWEFGDGKTSRKSKNSTVSHTYSKPGTFTVKLTVKEKFKFRVALMVVIINP